MFKVVGEGTAGIQVANFDDKISSDAVKHSTDAHARIAEQFIARGKDVGGTFEVGKGTAAVTVVTQTATPTSQSREDRGTATKETPADEVDEMNCYAMSGSPHGSVLIINNEKFRPSHLPDRDGTARDVQSLQTLFRQLGFRCDNDVDIHNNVTAEKMKQIVEKYAKTNHHSHDAAVVCILSHGQNNTVFGTDGKEVSLDQLVTLFYSKNAPSLKGKPKLFFIQACRGHGKDMADTNGSYNPALDHVEERSECDRWDDPDDSLKDTEWQLAFGCPKVSYDTDDSEGGLPETADILLAYSAYKGYRSYRNTMRGSYFVQTLCDVFCRHYQHNHVMEMLTQVKSQVADDVKACGLYKMMPVTEASLRKKLYFRPT